MQDTGYATAQLEIARDHLRDGDGLEDALELVYRALDSKSHAFAYIHANEAYRWLARNCVSHGIATPKAGAADALGRALDELARLALAGEEVAS